MFFRKEKNASPVKWAASFFAMIFISQLPVILCLFSRKYSRERRLILLRVAAWPTFFVTVMPRRVRSYRPWANREIKYLFWTFFPNFDNRRNSERFKIRSALVKEKGFKSDRQTLSSLGSSPFDNPSALFCWHPFQKTMSSGTLNSAWLIRSFHNTKVLYYNFIRLILLFTHKRPLMSSLKNTKLKIPIKMKPRCTGLW